MSGVFWVNKMLGVPKGVDRADPAPPALLASSGAIEEGAGGTVTAAAEAAAAAAALFGRTQYAGY